MTPALKPVGRYAYGLVIAVMMHSSSVAPRIRFDAAVWQSLRRRWSRFGPIVPVAPAAASVWQEAQPPAPVKTALPAAAVAVLEAAGALPEAAGAVLARGAPAPGMPLWSSLGGRLPTGGGALAGCDRSQAWKAAGVTTRTVARISE